MQFKVPQNIDMEDKIVGPLTLTQFLYVLAGGIIDYILFQTIYPTSAIIFFVLAIPIALIFLALAFLKIQDQPLSHFIYASIQYYTNPKTRLWGRTISATQIVQAPVKDKKIAATVVRKKVEKSDLERLSYVLDTKPMSQNEVQNFGKITAGFEKLLQNDRMQQAPGQNMGQGARQ